MYEILNQIEPQAGEPANIEKRVMGGHVNSPQGQNSDQSNDGVSPAQEGDSKSELLHEQHVITKFDEDNPNQTLRDDRGYSETIINDLPSSYDSEDILSFLQRPYKMQNVKFSASDVRNDRIIDIDIREMIRNTQMWKRKLDGYKYLSANIKFKVQVNAQPFQAGMLLLNHCPLHQVAFTGEPTAQSAHALWSASNVANAYQLPCTELDIRDTTAELLCPFIAAEEAFVIGSSSSSNAISSSWGSFRVTVVSPLSDPTGSDVSVTVWAWMENVRLSGNVYPQSSQPTRRGRRSNVKKIGEREQVQKANEGILSQVAGQVSSMASSLGDEIPMLASIAKPVSWISGAISGAANFFGYSKPLKDSTFDYFIERKYRHVGNAHGSTASESLGLMSDNSLSVLDGFANSKYDEMSFDFLKQIETPSHIFNWTALDAEGAVIHSHKVGPQTTRYEFTKDTRTLNVFPPIYYVGRYFSFYRGSMRVRIKFVKTRFHVGRVAINFFPEQTVGTPSSGSEKEYLLREIVDLTECDEITLDLPFISNVPWVSTFSSMGFIEIEVLNQLRATSTVSDSIEVLMFFSGGKDLEFSGLMNPVDLGDPVVPQAGGSMEYGVTGIGSAVIPNPNYLVHGKSNGEVCCSVKSMLQRYYPHYIGDSGVNDTIINPRIMKLDGLVGDVVFAGAAENAVSLFDILGAGYVLHRGTLNVLVSGKLVVGLESAYDSTANYPRLGLSNGITPDHALYSIVRNKRSNIILPISDGDSGEYTFVQFPQYSSAKAVTSYVLSSSTFIEAACKFIDYAKIRISKQNWEERGSSSQATTAFRSVGDDYQMGGFVGFPPILVE